MTKIELIEQAIEKAINRESKLTPLAMSVPMLGSLQIRHLLNNLGAISSSFLDVGSHRGGSYCSAVFKNNNLDDAAAVDSWASDLTEGEHHEEDFRDNSAMFTPANVEKPTIMNIIKSDAFGVDLSLFDGKKVDFYSYDAGHGFEDQKNALLYYKPILADEFIYVCDDFNWGEVKQGTFAGIQEGGYQILYYRELSNTDPNSDEHNNNEWWRGYGVFLLKKQA
jgi:hypothetical protein